MKPCHLAQSHNLFISSSAFQDKQIHKGPWKIPGKQQHNQIDHILVKKRRRSTIQDVRTLRGPNCDSDNFLVRVKIEE
jgi:endonuclease/exonuclease/phosphatase family metal-dependent hydrolase